VPRPAWLAVSCPHFAHSRARAATSAETRSLHTVNTSADAVLDAVYLAIERLNETMPPDRRVPKDPDARLGGVGGHLDSLGLVNLIVETEQVIEERFGRYVNLGDERSASQAQNPLGSVSSLASYIRACLDGRGDD
jgi:hypothetical protein